MYAVINSYGKEFVATRNDSGKYGLIPVDDYVWHPEALMRCQDVWSLTERLSDNPAGFFSSAGYSGAAYNSITLYSNDCFAKMCQERRQRQADIESGVGF